MLPSSPWYEASPVGKEKLRTFVQVTCKEAGISEHKMNHSLQAARATALFTADIPEKIIQEVIGHRSSAVMAYERPTIQQRGSVFRVDEW